MCLFELWFSLDICPVVGLLDHMVIQDVFLNDGSVVTSDPVILMLPPPPLPQGPSCEAHP